MSAATIFKHFLIALCHTLDAVGADRRSWRKTSLWLYTYLPLLWGSKPRKSLVCYGGNVEAKKWQTNCPRGMPHAQFFPVRAAPQSLWQAADPIILRNGQRVRLSLLWGSEGLTNHVFERDNQQIFNRSAVHIWGQRPSHMLIWHPFFRVSLKDQAVAQNINKRQLKQILCLQ
jgi:hypothetical protein